MFYCDKCGLCCQHISNIDIYRSLDNGNGVCVNFDESTKLCKIYSERPLICRVDEAYDALFKNKISKEEYYRLNYLACNKLKSEG